MKEELIALYTIVLSILFLLFLSPPLSKIWFLLRTHYVRPQMHVRRFFSSHYRYSCYPNAPPPLRIMSIPTWYAPWYALHNHVEVKSNRHKICSNDLRNCSQRKLSKDIRHSPSLKTHTRQDIQIILIQISKTTSSFNSCSTQMAYKVSNLLILVTMWPE